VALSTAGCGDADLNVGSSGGSKGPEITASIETGRPGPVGASSLSQSTSSTPFVPTPPACGEGLACIGNGGGCLGACDPATGMITACAQCNDGVLAACTQHVCQP
jgi:hypothetical protein